MGGARRRSFVDDLEAVGDLETLGRGFVAVDVGDGDDLFAGARVVVFDDEIDGEVEGVPILVSDGDGLAGTADGGVDGTLLLGAGRMVLSTTVRRGRSG